MRRALNMPREMRKAGVAPNVITYNCLIKACAVAGSNQTKLAKALSLLEHMRSEGIEPNLISYNTAMSACEKCRQWREALALLEEMSGEGIQPAVITYRLAISACDKGGQWREALGLLKQMREAGTQPDVITYNAAIAACEKDCQWKKALSLLMQMLGDGIEPNVITYGTLIAACGKGGQWEQALRLLQLCRAGMTPSAATYSAAIRACAGQPVSALRIFDDARRECGADIATHNAILDAVCASHPAKARALYRRGRRLYGAVEDVEDGVPLLDLHGHSLGAGETAVRWWLAERAPAMPGPPARLIVVTGWGRSISRRASKIGHLRGRVTRVLAALGVPTLPVDNPGRIVVDAREWRRVQAHGCGRGPMSHVPNVCPRARLIEDGDEPLVPHLPLQTCI